MSCPSECPSARPASGNLFSPRFENVRRRLNFDSTSSSSSPIRQSMTRTPPGDRYESFRQATRNAANSTALGSTSYQRRGTPTAQNISQYIPQDISAIGPPPRRSSPGRTYQNICPGGRPQSPRDRTQETYFNLPPIQFPKRQQTTPRFAAPRMSPTDFSEAGERPSRTIHSSRITDRPGEHIVSDEVRQIYDRSGIRSPGRSQCSGAAQNATYTRGNATFDVAPMSNSRQVSFVPPNASMQPSYTNITEEVSEIYDSSEDDRSLPFPKRNSTCPGYQIPNATYGVPNRTYSKRTPDATYNVSGSSYKSRSPCSASFDRTAGSSSPLQTTVTEETTEIYDSSDEMDESLLGKILRGEIGRNIQPMTPSDPKIRPDATYNKADALNATYSVTPVHSQQSFECPCSDAKSSSSFRPSATSTPTKKDVNKSIEGELDKREREERKQLEHDLRKWQKARRRLVLDTSNISSTPT